MLKLELNMGSLCNFQCSYCFENGVNARSNVPPHTQVSAELLARYAEFIAWFKNNVCGDEDILVPVYGGEPFLRMSDLQTFIRSIDPYIWGVNLITNGSLVPENIAVLAQMRAENQATIITNVSYDYALQNETRESDSYETVRNGIRLLYKNNFTRRTISVFTAKDIHRIDEVFFDFISLREELPELCAVFNIDRFGPSFESVDDNALCASLERIQTYLFDHPEIRGAFLLNDNSGRTRKASLRGNFQETICFAMYYDGYCYPGYEVPWEQKNVANMLCFGHINDSFEQLEQRRQEIMAALPQGIPDKCTICNASCRVTPWRTVKKSLSEWNGMPQDPAHCHIHKLLTQYLV